MRISDWSSDVCSSDLLGEAHRYPDPLGGDLKRLLAAKHGVEAPQIVLGNGSHELLMQLAQVFAGPGVDVVMSQFGFAVYAIAAQAVGATLRVAPALPADARMPRSEEHTSELQSLMRISYAVFCLKKKNNNKTHRK